jgi:uncharacterized repeat protein (TIGR01451 family)
LYLNKPIFLYPIKDNLMKKISTLLLTLFIVLLCNQLKANDTLVRFGQNLVGAAQWSYKGGGTNLDAVPTWKTLAYAEPGWLTLQPQALGFGGSPPVRNTAIPEDATAGGGGVAGARYPTLYFRKVVNVSAPQLTSYIDFIVQSKFDDAIIVWVNGVEAYRNNISTIPALYATLADGAMGNSGGDIYTANIPKSLFIAGNNIIAVEIHQSALSSSDLFFDFQLIGNTAPGNLGRPFTVRYNNTSEKGNILFVANNIVTTTGIATTEVPPGGSATNNGGNGEYIDIDNPTTNLFNLGSAWKWFSAGAIPALDWNTNTYNDAAWAAGNGELGYGDGDETTCIPYGCGGNVCNPAAGCSKYWTYYFRKTINITSLAGINQFLFNYKRDDGIVIYVNGTEILRENMPGGAIAYNTPASGNISNENAVVAYTLNGISPFIIGNNVIAVEVHQETQGSSDISFDMSLNMLGSNGTFSSSSADLNLPSTCSEVLFAGLYWGATLGGTNSPGWRVGHDTVKLKIPGASTYVNVVSSQTDVHDFGIPTGGQDHIGYSAFKDITSLLNTTNANGTYTIANMVAPTGLNNCAGGWTIVIAYKDLSDPVTRNLVVFDGAQFVTSSTFVDVPFAGFQTPVVGPVTADFGVVCYDGDRSSNDGFFFKQDSAAAGVYLDMSLPVNAISTSNSTGDSWNSTISYLNSVVTTRNPAHNNTLGFDADIIRLNNPFNLNLNNNKTSARLRLNSSGERYYLQTITSAISVATPTFRGGITSADINGGANFAPGDSLRYVINWQNRGSDTAIKVYVVDTIPQNVTYKRNSLKIGAVPKTDAIGDDEAEWDSAGNRVVFRVGTGATTTVGGQVLPNPLPGNNGTVSFDVNAIDICALLKCNAAVLNRAFTYYTGKTSGEDFSDIIASVAVGCASAGPIRDTIIGACYSQKDTLLNNRCLGTAVVLPTGNYPGYSFYTAMPFIPANLFSPPNTPITATRTYYARILTKDGCLDTVVLKVRIVNCLDIDDDDDGIPDYVETMNALAFADHDLDLIPNWNDAQYPGRVDYNGDLVDDRFDAGADADNDGVPNYYDKDFVFGGSFIDVNNDGVNDRYDTDLDGIINQFDADSDNDGIPDVVESYGVDANGDGVIDNYSDTDGDGFSQNVDGSAGGTNSSGKGLDYLDLDGDGKGNAIDLDSDNDGIPDIREAYGADANNNGLVDGTFVDFDIDGFQDALDGDADLTAGAENTAGALLLSGADVVIDGRADNWPNKNLDRDFRPNAYDIDSDADGILDVIEAGLPDIAAPFGVVDGAIGTNGWSAAISGMPSLNLINTDAGGNPDYLDIDSDDDGIPDNIEGLSTVGYKLPGITDTDGDGLVDTYETAPSLNVFGGAGNGFYNHGGSPLPDYRDLDTDGDGQPDIIEGNDFNLNGLADDLVTLTGLDSDGDGLDNRFDSLNSVTNIKGTSYRMGTGGTLTGDPAPGSRTTVQKKVFAQSDRDWRSVGVVLPVQILNFSGSLQHTQVPLSWTIITTKEIDHFEIERSIDNTTYTKVGVVTDAVKLNEEQSFGFTDDITGLNSDILYYRLKVIGKAGEIKYSNILGVRKTPLKADVTIMPNPANNHININLYSDKNVQAQLILIDKLGRKVLTQKRNLLRGSNKIYVPINKYTEGVYAVIIEIAGERIVKQFIISR